MGGFVGLFVALNSFTLIHNGMEGRGVKGDKCTRGQGRENVCSLRGIERERNVSCVCSTFLSQQLFQDTAAAIWHWL